MKVIRRRRWGQWSSEHWTVLGGRPHRFQMFGTYLHVKYIVSPIFQTVVLEHQQILRTHGRERTDHPDAVAALSTLPDTLWSAEPTHVGLVTCLRVLFQLKSEAPIWRPQYRHKPEAEGIAETIEGLLKVRVLEPSQSFWNTPFLLVEKHRKGKCRWCMTSGPLMPFSVLTLYLFQIPIQR